ncbi:hypothetical protein VQ056_06395 [Paenibacillus sp. JTLBN-2024]
MAKPKPISVYVDGVKLNPLQPPTMTKGRTMLPMRAIFERRLTPRFCGIKKQARSRPYATTSTIVLKIGAKTATVNQQKVTP